MRVTRVRFKEVLYEAGLHLNDAATERLLSIFVDNR